MTEVATTTFLDAVVPEGNRYIGYTDGTKSKQSNREIIKCSAFESSSNGWRTGSWRDGQDNVKNVYFALASFKQAKVYDEKGGYEKSFRHQSNVEQLKSLWLDIDFKQYDTPAACVADIVRWIEQVRIPHPTFIVNSGGGIHLYWCFENPLSPETWLPLAQGLASLAKQGELRADFGVTIDSARVLRLPGTHNLKYPSAPVCKITQMGAYAYLDRMKELLEPHAAGTPTNMNMDFTIDPDVIQMFPSASDDLSHGYTSGRKSYVAEARKQCGMLDDAIKTGGAGHEYGYWKDVLHVLAFMEDGESYVHKVSEKHAGYKEDVTEERYQESVTVKVNESRGPTSCARFSQYRKECQSCPHFGKVKSPWNLGYQAAENPSNQTDPTFASGGQTYFWKAGDPDEDTGEVVMEKKVIANAELKDWVLLSGLDGEDILECSAALRKRKKRLSWDRQTLADARRFKEELVKGYGPENRFELQLIQEKAMAWLNHLRDTKEAVQLNSTGWSDTGEMFVLGDRAIYTGETNTVSVDTELARDYSPVGKPEIWSKLAQKLADDAHPAMAFILATAGAGPLARIGVPCSLAISCFGETGTGKTTAVRCAQAMWGNPKKSMALDDTLNYVVDRASKLRDLPLYWDEVRGQEASKAVAKLMFQLTQGKTKGRASNDGSARQTFEIENILCCATNTPIADAVEAYDPDSDAGRMRFLEFELGKKDASSFDREITELSGKLLSNYGHAGETYVHFLQKNYADLPKLLEKSEEALRKQFDFTQEMRFWLHGMAKVVAAAYLMQKSGVVNIDPTRVASFAIEIIKTNSHRYTVEHKERENPIVQMVNARLDEVLITDSFLQSAGRPAGSSILIKRHPRNGKASFHLSANDKKLRVSLSSLKQYCTDTHHSYTLLVRAMKQSYNATSGKTTLGGGTVYAGAQTRMLEVDISSTVGDDIIDGWSSADPQPAPRGTS